MQAGLLSCPNSNSMKKMRSTIKRDQMAQGFLLTTVAFISPLMTEHEALPSLLSSVAQCNHFLSRFCSHIFAFFWVEEELKMGKENSSEYPYPFIRRASSFSSSSPSASLSGSHNTYDYIIVGGGTAGCPLAATLSQNFSVLLLERVVPLLIMARVLGGGTCINAGFYTRASTRYIEEAGWDAKLVNESYPWIERQIVQQPKLAPWQKALRDGLLEVGISPFNGFTFDHLYGTKVGGTIFDEFGKRHTAADLLAEGNPEKLSVLIYAKVQKIMFNTTVPAIFKIALQNTDELTMSDTAKRPKAVGVIFKDENGNQHQAFLAERRGSEIILSCGAIGSPQMLMLSGIGPKAELKKFNISVVLNNRFVGKGLSDNPLNTVFVPTDRPVEQSLIQTVGITKRGVYIEASSGFGQSSDSIRYDHGMMSAEIGQLSTIPPRQRTAQAIQDYAAGKQFLPHEAFMGGFILEKIASPFSKGHLKLINTNVDDNPSITFNYFSHPYDLQRCVEGIRMMEKIVRTQHFMNYTQCDDTTLDKLLNMSVKANINLVPKHTNDTKSMEQFCKDTVITIWHYHGGCHVGKVVDHKYKVLGVHRLRVIDGSTFRESPGTNPQATVMMMGRYMGLKILRERLGAAAGV
ncbi:Protein HOTHEAD [Vitis vinifera]|uniref:Protein HOTHEAD n=1 Tax=Vitis vinifera TaxID=29760 RepID=A0A438EW80_VITVI|nr:Protein HOTHEAD [Vitis vinifera]